jgi:hypothetical protein
MNERTFNVIWYVNTAFALTACGALLLVAVASLYR